MKRILIIEDETVIRTQMGKLLAREGYRVDAVDNVASAVDMGLSQFDLIIADVRLPGAPGTEVIEQAHPVPVLIMTSYASIQSAVDCIKRGAADYVAKPFDHDELLITIRRILDHALLTRAHAALKSSLAREYPISGMIGSCPAMLELSERVQRVAAADVTVLVLGESGTGKELVARAIHEHSPRSSGPFVAVNCAAIPENLIESELFGHEKGSFTGATTRKTGLIEEASGGTLFLDEVAELAPAAQARLLRVLQEGEIRAVGANRTRQVDVRVVAATHRSLPQMVTEGKFREDLLYRLAVTEVNLPPLRERGDDIAQLVEHFLNRARRRLSRPDLALSEDAWNAIHRYNWPGNIRELGNAIERASILARTARIEPDDLALPGEHARAPLASADSRSARLEDYFRDFVSKNQDHLTETELAKALGISRKTLWERRSRMKLPRNKL